MGTVSQIKDLDSSALLSFAKKEDHPHAPGIPSVLCRGHRRVRRQPPAVDPFRKPGAGGAAGLRLRRRPFLHAGLHPLCLGGPALPAAFPAVPVPGGSLRRPRRLRREPGLLLGRPAAGNVPLLREKADAPHRRRLRHRLRRLRGPLPGARHVRRGQPDPAGPGRSSRRISGLLRPSASPPAAAFLPRPGRRSPRTAARNMSCR